MGGKNCKKKSFHGHARLKCETVAASSFTLWFIFFVNRTRTQPTTTPKIPIISFEYISLSSIVELIIDYSHSDQFLMH
jgi:hypothetical protein